MRGFLAVLKRELHERRLLPVVALAAGLIPLALPWLPGTGRLGAAEVRSGTALGLCLVVTAVLALVLGGSVIARDLAEGRLGFYFSRPLSGWAVWAGKLAAAAVLTVGAGILVLLPALLTGGVDVRSWWNGGEVFGSSVLAAGLAGLGILLLLLLSAHAVSVMVRSRSPWLLLDLLAAPLVGSLAMDIVRRLAREGALGMVGILAMLAVAALVFALLVGGAVQVVHGRTDLRRGHRFLSLTLWGVLLSFTLAGQAVAHWLVETSPRDLARIYELRPAPAGPWIGLSGPAEHRNGFVPAFLLDTRTGRSIRIRSPWGFSGLVFAADGSRVVWLEPEGGIIRPSRLDLVRLDLRAPDPSPRGTTVSYDRFPRLALSPDGRLLASLAGRRLTVEEVDGGRVLAVADVDTDSGSDDLLRFVGPSRLRLYLSWVHDALGSGWQHRVRIFELDPVGEGKGGLRQVGHLEGQGFPFWELSPDGRFLLLREARSRTLQVFDAVTGAPFATWALPDGRSLNANFLADGRVAVRVTGDGWCELRVSAPDFSLVQSFRFPAARGLRLGGQPAPDRLIVAVSTRQDRGEPAGWEARVLDLATGGIRALGTDLLPAAPLTGPASAGSRLLLRGEHELVVLDPETGRERVVLPGD